MDGARRWRGPVVFAIAKAALEIQRGQVCAKFYDSSN
jgi:hypothetical protein